MANKTKTHIYFDLVFITIMIGLVAYAGIIGGFVWLLMYYVLMSITFYFLKWIEKKGN